MSQLLNCSYMSLVSLRPCLPCPETNLTHIYASRNNLCDLDPLEGHKCIEELYLRQNAISSLTQLRPLKELPNLTLLTLQGNPIVDRIHYMDEVANFLPQLKSLDGCDNLEECRKRYASRTKCHKVVTERPSPRVPTPPRSLSMRQEEALQTHVDRQNTPNSRRNKSLRPPPVTSTRHESASTSSLQGKAESSAVSPKSVQDAVVDAIETLGEALDNDALEKAIECLTRKKQLYR